MTQRMAESGRGSFHDAVHGQCTFEVEGPGYLCEGNGGECPNSGDFHVRYGVAEPDGSRATWLCALCFQARFQFHPGNVAR